MPIQDCINKDIFLKEKGGVFSDAQKSNIFTHALNDDYTNLKERTRDILAINTPLHLSSLFGVLQRIEQIE